MTTFFDDDATPQTFVVTEKLEQKWIYAGTGFANARESRTMGYELDRNFRQ